MAERVEHRSEQSAAPPRQIERRPELTRREAGARLLQIVGGAGVLAAIDLGAGFGLQALRQHRRLVDDHGRLVLDVVAAPAAKAEVAERSGGAQQ